MPNERADVGQVEMTKEAVLERMEGRYFFQTVDLGQGIKTPGNKLGAQQKIVLDIIRSLDLEGKRVVDLGTSNALLAMEAERCGAGEVIAVDNTAENIDILNSIIIPFTKSKIVPLKKNVLEMNSETEGEFDVVIFSGLLYHLRYPFLAFKVLRDLIEDNGELILETAVMDDFNRKALLYCPGPKDGPYRGRGANSCSFFNTRAVLETLEAFGFRVKSRHYDVSGLKLMVKKVAGILPGPYDPISRLVVHCVRDASLEDPELRKFYEGTA